MKKLTTSFLLLLTILSHSRLYSQVDLQNGLMVYFPFSGNASDVSGNGKHGTVNNAILTKDRCGKPNSAYSFNGTNAYIEIPASTLQTQYYSYSIWVNASEIPGTGKYTYPFAIGSTGGGQNIALTNNSMNGWAGGGYNSGTPSLSLVAKGSQPSVNVWYHIVFIRDTSKIKLYINGVLNTYEVNYSGATPSTGGNMPNYGSSPKALIGNRDLSSAFYFKGLIDDLRVYNRVLNQAEIDSLYNEKCDTPKINLPIGLLAHYPFTGNAGDSSGNGKHGTVTNATLAKDRCGNANSAYYFNGTDAHIEIPSATFLTQFCSYSLWVNASEIPGSGEYTYPFAIGSSGGGQNVAIANNSMTGWAGGSYNDGTPSLSLVAKGSMPTTDRWYHLVYIRDSFKIKLYIDGKLNTNEVSYGGSNTSTGGHNPNFGASPKAYFGTRDLLSQFYFKGLIDDVRIYDRPLDEMEIDSLFKEKPCFITSIADYIKKDMNVRLYPNPATRQLYIDIDPRNAGPINIKITNSIGAEVVTGRITENQSVISLPDLTSGIYTVVLEGICGNIIQKIIIN